MARVDTVAAELLLADPRGRRQAHFHGPTMEPFLRDGDLLGIAAVVPAEIRAGDIVAVRRGNTFPICRVARHSRGELFLVTDAWADFNMTVAAADVIGKVVRRTRAGRTLSSAHWRWRLGAANAIARERMRSASAQVRRKRENFRIDQSPPGSSPSTVAS